MLRRLPLLLTMAHGAIASVAGQEPLPLLSVDVDLRDFGIASVDDVMRGRVSIAYAPDGPRLTTYYLRDTPRPPRPAVMPPEPRF